MKIGDQGQMILIVLQMDGMKFVAELQMNCNFSFGHYGYCPHQKPMTTPQSLNTSSLSISDKDGFVRPWKEGCEDS
jgi:hypothetical protein